MQIAGAAKRVAVLGIKTEEKAGQPAFFVPEYLQEHGVEIIPVPGACASGLHAGCLHSRGAALRRASAEAAAPPALPALCLVLLFCCMHKAPAGLTRLRSLTCLHATRIPPGLPPLPSLPCSLPGPPPTIHPPPPPVYYPDVKEILGRPVVRDLRAIRQPVDILDVFRRPQDLPQVGCWVGGREGAGRAEADTRRPPPAGPAAGEVRWAGWQGRGCQAAGGLRRAICRRRKQLPQVGGAHACAAGAGEVGNGCG